MTLEEVEAQLPNGFHDAVMSRVDLDYRARSACFHFDVWVGDMDARSGAEREQRRTGVLKLEGLLFCTIEAPDPNYPYTDEPWTSELIPVDPPSALPAGAFEAKFFVPQWNSFIHVAGNNAAMEWE